MMQEQNKVYGFTISLFEWQQTIPSLWNTVKEFMKEYPQHIAENNAIDFISNDGGNSYNLCHCAFRLSLISVLASKCIYSSLPFASPVWSNFEIADMEFWRSPAYTAFFEYLEKSGGFYYERWGDAPVHSIAAALFARKDQVHFFRDVGYRHDPFQRCPQGHFHQEGKCWCDPTDSFGEFRFVSPDSKF